MLSAQVLFGLISWIPSPGWYHEPLPGTSLLLHVFIHILGMTWISPIFAATADAPVASSVALDVQTDVIGDGEGLEDEHGEGASTSAFVDNDVTPPSSWSPPDDMISTFDTLFGIKTVTWGNTKSWTAPAFALSEAFQVSTCPLRSSQKTILSTTCNLYDGLFLRCSSFFDARCSLR